MTRHVAVLAALVAVALASACGADSGEDGGGEPSETRRLTGPERHLVADSEAAIERYCRRFALFRLQQAPAPARELEARAFAAAEAVSGLAARKPTATVSPHEELQLYLGDLVESFDASNCDPRLQATLAAGL